MGVTTYKQENNVNIEFIHIDFQLNSKAVLQQAAIVHFCVACASVWKRVFLQNLCYQNNFDLHRNETIGETHC